MDIKSLKGAEHSCKSDEKQGCMIGSLTHGDANRFAGRADSNPLKRTEIRSIGCNAIMIRIDERRHMWWCSVEKKERIRYHVTTKSAIG